MTERRKGIDYALNLLLSLVFPGLGQIHARKYLRALIYPVVFVTLATVAKYSFLSSIVGFFVLITLEIGIRIFALIESLISLKKSQPLTNWYAIVGVLLVGILMNFVLPVDLTSKFGDYRTYEATSDNMRNTLFTGDHIVVSFKDTDINNLKRNDIVVYKVDAAVRISRVVGFGNDKVAMSSGRLYVNDEIVDQEYAYFDDPKGADVREEELKDPQSDLVKLYQSITPIRLTESQAYLLGDNRFNSLDSRFIGPIDRSTIVAKVLYLTFSEDFSRLGLPLASSN